MNMRKTPRTRHEGAFTLLELIISITLIAIMAVIVTGAFRLGFRSTNAGEKKIEFLERLRRSFFIMDAQIQSTMLLTFDENGIQKPYFEGSTASLRVATNFSIWGGQRGYVVARYSAKPDGSGKFILVASENLVGTSQTRETTLLKDLDTVQFEYWLKDSLEEEGAWQEEWQDETRVPERVKVTVSHRGEEHALVIPIRVRGPST
ncbi:MAG: ral secretion pathway protein [Deltaproteobacteria bacterium]|nr:ral secretion pathway protein [Deltaproteobacteria bacterium]